MLVATTQLTGCFPVLAGAMAGGVVSATDRRPTGTQAIDRGLQLEAENTLRTRYDGAARVNVTVYNRKVLLTGEVKDANTKQQIDQYVRGLQNAREVINELEVKSSPGFSEQSQDAYITSKVKTLLVATEGVPSNSIKVTTERGAVYLLGVVTPIEGERATEQTRTVSGVTKVVKAFDYVTDAERARLDAAASSQNSPPGDNVEGVSTGLQSGGTSAAPTTITTGSGASVGGTVPAITAPVAPATPAAPAASGTATTTPGVTVSPAPVETSPAPIALPPGRNLP
ncbi:BON domain-containing protein [Paracidovorax citrulli]